MSEATDSQPKGKGKPRYPKSNKEKIIVEKSVEPKKPPEPIKKVYKILIRKLPVRDFSAEDFASCLDNVCATLNLPRDGFRVEHFSEGKISRKRGPVFGAGFVSVQDESQYLTFLSQCPSKVPFIAVDDINSQPEVIAALNQRPYRTKFQEKVDKYVNTFETDPDFLEFKANLEKPVEKLLSAELQMDKLKETPAALAAQLAAQIKNNPLLKFLREKAERKIQERRAAKSKMTSGSAKGVLVSGVLSRNSGSSGNLTKTKKSSSASREAKEPKVPKEPKSASSGAGGKKEIRLLSRNSAVPADSPLAASLANVKPIARSNAQSGAGGADGAATEEGGPPKLSRKEKEREKERQREARKLQQQQQGVGVAEGDAGAAAAATGKEHKSRPPRKERAERPPRGDTHGEATSGSQPPVILKQNHGN